MLAWSHAGFAQVGAVGGGVVEEGICELRGYGVGGRAEAGDEGFREGFWGGGFGGVFVEGGAEDCGGVRIDVWSWLEGCNACRSSASRPWSLARSFVTSWRDEIVFVVLFVVSERDEAR